VDLLISDLTVAAKEAIEKAAGEAAKAAALASVEREAAAMREVAKWRLEAETARRAGIKNTIIAALIGTLGGLALGVVINR
jgi:regulator of protease activity HflC (stomatin/prohibitin superfamily)